MGFFCPKLFLVAYMFLNMEQRVPKMGIFDFLLGAIGYRLNFQYGLKASKLDFLHSCLDFFALNDFAGLKPAQTNQAHTKGGHWTHF